MASAIDIASTKVAAPPETSAPASEPTLATPARQALAAPEASGKRRHRRHGPRLSPLTRRIIVVNVLPLALLALGFLYLGKFESSLIGQQVEALRTQRHAPSDDRITLADLTLVATASATQQMAASPSGPTGAAPSGGRGGGHEDAKHHHAGGLEAHVSGLPSRKCGIMTAEDHSQQAHSVENPASTPSATTASSGATGSGNGPGRYAWE